MKRIVDIAVSHARLTIAVLLFLLAAGALSYLSIPKESQPDVQIPYIYVQLSDRGISPEDAAPDGDAAQDGRRREADAFRRV
jgi:multidrug efflux pump